MPTVTLMSAAVIGTGLFGGLVLLATGLILGLRETGRRLADLRAEVLQSSVDRAMAITDLAAAVERLETRLAAQRDEGLSSVSADLAAIRAEVEWLGGERMIEEAVRMCREGIPARRVGEELGISADSMRVISLLRAN
jgi:hypothetical protein